MTLKSLQTELYVFREELKITRKELTDVKEEIKNVKDERKSEKETVEDPKGISEKEFSCKICDQSFRSKKTLKYHNQSNHNKLIKFKSCDKTFENNCDLELHINENHDSAEHLECVKCGKRFVLEWRLKKHQEIHTNQNIRKCHYFNNQKCCPFEVIGCMFAHSLAGKCKYGEKCSKMLCSFQHQKNGDAENEREDNLENIDKPFEMSGDGNVKAVDETNDEDEQMFQLYVKTNCPAVFNKFTTEKSIKCYYCDFLPRSKKLRDLEDEMVKHIADTHKVAKEELDADNFDDEYHQDFVGLLLDACGHFEVFLGLLGN